MLRLLGSEFDVFLDCYAHPPRAGLRVNTLKLTSEEFQSISPYPLSPIPWCPSGFWVEPGTDSSPGKHPYHAAGLYYLQDPSAMAVAELLAPHPGELVLDLAAAPGGKSTHLAGLMGNQGVLIANEMHTKRAWELAENLERWGPWKTAILNETPERLANKFGGIFDRVLLDAPCSGEGMFRKSEAARRDWSTDHVQSCAVRQSGILKDAARLVRVGGKLAYATCTFAPEENEAVMARFLTEHPEFELVETGGVPGSDHGHPEWIETHEREGIPAHVLASLTRAIRLWPQHGMGEGHFIAILQRIVDVPANKQPRQEHGPRDTRLILDKGAARLFQDFCQGHLSVQFGDRIHLAGTYLYHIPPGMPDLGGLKAVHPGLWLGTIKKDRFEPSHALALALRADQAKLSLRLEPAEATSYLHGNTLAKDGNDGWVLLTVDGFPLGWGKRSQGVIKNFYPKGLRW